MSMTLTGNGVYTCVTCGHTMAFHTAFCPQCRQIEAAERMADAAEKAQERAENRQSMPIYEDRPVLNAKQQAAEDAKFAAWDRADKGKSFAMGVFLIIIGVVLFGYMASFGFIGAAYGGIFAAFFILFGLFMIVGAVL